MMKNTFYIMFKVLSVLEKFIFLSLFCGELEKLVDKEAMVDFKIFDVTDWTKNYCNARIMQYLKN